MKKFIVFLIVIALFGALTACRSTPATENSEPTETVSMDELPTLSDSIIVN